MALSTICEMQKAFGKTTAELKTLVAGYRYLLTAYPMDRIIAALKEYVLNKNDIPSPADIKNIIDPPPVPLSAANYVRIRKEAQDGQYITKAEREYCRAFEAQEMAKCRSGTDELRQAQAQLADHGRALSIGYEGDMQ